MTYRTMNYTAKLASAFSAITFSAIFSYFKFLVQIALLWIYLLIHVHHGSCSLMSVIVNATGGHELSKTTGNAGARVGCGMYFTSLAFCCCKKIVF